MTKIQVEEFRDWLLSSRTGQTYIYYIGDLASDRAVPRIFSDGSVHYCPDGPVDELGTLAHEAFAAHRVHLWQRKIHDHVYQYIAMKRRDGGRLW